MAGLFDMNFGQVMQSTPSRLTGANYYPATEPNVRGVLDLATNVPVAGDVLSGLLAGYDAYQGDYGSAALNAAGMIPFVPAMGGVVSTGKAGKWKNVFHGTTSDFDPKEFDLNKIGSSSKHASAEVPAMWVTTRPEVANIFTARNVIDSTPIDRYGPRGAGVKSIKTGNYIEGGNIQPLKAKLENPMVVSGADAQKMIFGGADSDWRDAGDAWSSFVKRAKESGHDGVIIRANPRGELEFRADQYLLFDPKTQVKSKFSK